MRARIQRLLGGIAPLLPVVAFALPGCILVGDPGPSVDNPVYTIDTGSSLSYTPQVDLGYYLAYEGSGHWHIEWTCNKMTTAPDGACLFSGSVTLYRNTPTSVTCTGCTQAPTVTGTSLSFSQVTTTGNVVLDFNDPVPGNTIQVDLSFDGAPSPQITNLPSGQQRTVAQAMPCQLTPSTP
jgi:hypothetical protein